MVAVSLVVAGCGPSAANPERTPELVRADTEEALFRIERCVDQAGFQFGFALNDNTGAISVSVDGPDGSGDLADEALEVCMDLHEFGSAQEEFLAVFGLSEVEILEGTQHVIACLRARGILVEDTDPVGVLLEKGGGDFAECAEQVGL